MILSVYNEGFEWFLDSGPDSVTLTAKDPVQGMTNNFPRISSGSLELAVLSKAKLSNNILAGVPVTPN